MHEASVGRLHTWWNHSFPGLSSAYNFSGPLNELVFSLVHSQFTHFLTRQRRTTDRDSSRRFITFSSAYLFTKDACSGAIVKENEHSVQSTWQLKMAAGPQPCPNMVRKWWRNPLPWYKLFIPRLLRVFPQNPQECAAPSGFSTHSLGFLL